MKKIYFAVFILGVVLGLAARAQSFNQADPNLSRSSISSAPLAIGVDCPDGTCFQQASSTPLDRHTVYMPKSTGDESGATKKTTK